jgi:hypothetical protein
MLQTSNPNLTLVLALSLYPQIYSIIYFIFSHDEKLKKAWVKHNTMMFKLG